MGGRLEVVCGPMFSGKSEELIRRLRRSQIVSTVYSFKPKIDDRYSDNNIVSHSKQHFASVAVNNSHDVHMAMEKVPSPAVVGLDEVQLFDEGIIPVISGLLDRGFNVIAAGLDTDYLKKPFVITAMLLAASDELVKLYSICMKCHGEATKTYRKDHSLTGRIAVGGSDMYEARCSKCHDLKE